ncbi:MAG: hypothetical protein ABI797_04080 [Chloroflexota bacterium]
MTGHSLRARLTMALALGVLLLSAVATPASAAVQIRWVDDDNRNGDGPRQCNNAGFHNIQAAINASGPWDKVYVCPGNYTGFLTIDVRGLEVRSMPALGAKLYPPNAPVGPFGIGPEALVTITARDAQLVGFWLKFLDGDPEIFLPAIPTTCANVDVAILVLAPHAIVKANHIKTRGDNTYIGECGYNIGIVVDDEWDNLFGPTLLWRNWIRDFKFAGILVEPGSSARLWNNQIRFVHYNDPATCNLIPVLGILPTIDAIFPCELDFAPPDVAPLNGLFIGESAGILVEGAKVDLRANSVYSTLDTAVLAGPIPIVLAAGIVLIDPVDGSRVRSNRVDNTGIGLLLAEGDVDVPLALPTAPDGLAVSGNRVSETIFSFIVDGTDGVYYGNRAHLNIFGMLVGTDAADNTFIQNDFRYNVVIDCADESTTDASGADTLGTNNDWDAVNLGFEDDPDGLCYDFFPIV